MLEMRPDCECCGADVAPDAPGAWICSFECTFCDTCARKVLACTCPNCGGELVPRPQRPTAKLERFPASTQRHARAKKCLETGQETESGT